MSTYRVTGQHAIRVASGYFTPSSTGVALTEAEAKTLTSCGAVTAEDVLAQASKPRVITDELHESKKSAGLPTERGTGVAGASRINED